VIAVPTKNQPLMKTWPNGLTLMTQKVSHAQSVVVHGYLRSGAILDPSEKEGLAAITAALLFTGTKRSAKSKVLAQFDSCGARVTAEAGRHLTVFKAHCLAGDFPLVLEILTDSLRFPAFPSDAWKRERHRLLQSLQWQEQNASRVAELNFRRALYGDEHPYARASQPTLRVIERLTIDAVRDFQRMTYGPRGAVIVVVGACEPHEVEQQVAKQWGGWRVSRSLYTHDLPHPPIFPNAGVSWQQLSYCRQARLLIGGRGPSRFSPDYYAARVANVILGKLGMNGRIGQCLRRRGLTHDCGSLLGGGLWAEPWLVYAAPHPSHARAAVDLLADELRLICSELVSDEELADAKAHLIASKQMATAELAGLATHLAEAYLYVFEKYHWPDYFTQISQVDKEVVRAVAQRYLGNPTIVVVSNEAVR
jgi:zinc protease